MGSFSRLNNAIKHMAVEAVDASKAVVFMFGTVTSIAPLEIQIDQKLFLGAQWIILTDAVRDYYVDITVDHQTETEGAHTHQYFDSDTGQGASGSQTRTSDPTTHLHAYTGRKRFLIHNGLQVGEKVLMMRFQGGQKWLVLNRVVEA